MPREFTLVSADENLEEMHWNEMFLVLSNFKLTGELPPDQDINESSALFYEVPSLYRVCLFC
tara:strand:- start:366 stop:551 length:186 start_codon:yes stop_codon:yes gene_type:complete